MMSSSDDDDEFHDTLERRLSSSCSSTSASDDDLPSPVSSSIWLSAPAPVADRRRRLLLHLGLTPPLPRRRSVSCDGLFDTDHHHDQLPPPPPPPLPPGLPKPNTASITNMATDDVRRLTIKNLDTGTQFVVKEFGEEVRELATGRQLTMEEFDLCAGRSPIVQELMRRETVSSEGDNSNTQTLKAKKKGGHGWLRSIKNGYQQRRLDDGNEGSKEWKKVRQYGRSRKELSGLYMSQEIDAHNGAIWCIKFSLDGQYLASAGEDCVIHVWKVVEKERKGSPYDGRVTDGMPEQLGCLEANHWEKKRRVKIAGGRRTASLDQVMVPENVFALDDKPVCSFRGHLNDVLDLSWSKSQYLLSSSMDKTVRLWEMSNKSCLKTFSHSDYVTCIQFNPVDDRFFISGSLDEKVRIWNIPDRQVVDWNDLHEMVTAACYTPDGQGALVGSHKGSCHMYDTSDNQLHKKSQIDMQNKKKKSISKKVTGFQFAPGSSSEVLITSADSRIRVTNGAKVVHKFKGFRNTSSQMTACVTANGKYVICASEDSHVYVWRYSAESRPKSNSVVTAAYSHEHFHCQDVTVAVPWSGTSGMERMLLGSRNIEESRPNGVPKPNPLELSHVTRNIANSSFHSDRISATWPEEKLMIADKCNTPRNGLVPFNASGMSLQSRSAWGMVIVTAGRGGKISTFQNFGLPPIGL